MWIHIFLLESLSLQRYFNLLISLHCLLLIVQVISKLSEQVILSVLPGMHAELEGLNKEAAELNYLKEAQTLPEYGMVFYNVSREKRKKIGSVCLGLSVRGIVVYSVYKGTKTPQSHWPWRKIKNLSFAVSELVILGYNTIIITAF